MKISRNKYLFWGSIITMIIMGFLFLFFVRDGLHEPSVIDKQVEKDAEVSELSPSGPHKEKEKVPERFILNLDDLDVVKRAGQEPKRNKAPGIRQDTMREAEIEDDYEKKEKGAVLYKKGRMSIRGEAGFSELPEKDDSLDELMDKSEVKGDIGVEF